PRRPDHARNDPRPRYNLPADVPLGARGARAGGVPARVRRHSRAARARRGRRGDAGAHGRAHAGRGRPHRGRRDVRRGGAAAPVRRGFRPGHLRRGDGRGHERLGASPPRARGVPRRAVRAGDRLGRADRARRGARSRRQRRHRQALPPGRPPLPRQRRIAWAPARGLSDLRSLKPLTPCRRACPGYRASPDWPGWLAMIMPSVLARSFVLLRAPGPLCGVGPLQSLHNVADGSYRRRHRAAQRSPCPLGVKIPGRGRRPAMKWINNLRIQTKLLGAFGLVLLLVGGAAGFGLYRLSGATAAYGELARTTMAASRMADDVNASFISRHKVLKDIYLFNGDPAKIEKAASEVKELDQAVEAGLSQLQSNPALLPDELALADEASRALGEYAAASRAAIARVQAGGDDLYEVQQAAVQLTSGKDRPVSEALDRLADDLDKRSG